MSNRYSDNLIPTSLYVRNVPHEARLYIIYLFNIDLILLML